MSDPAHISTTTGTRVKMRGRHPNPEGEIEAYEHEGRNARAFIRLDVPAGFLAGYWCEPHEYEVAT